MKRILATVLLMSGCSSESPKVEVEINGTPAMIANPAEREIDPKEAEEKLSEWKEKWFDKAGKFRNKVWTNLTMAASEAESISYNFQGTAASSKAKSYEQKLLAAKQEAKDNGNFPTLQSLE